MNRTPGQMYLFDFPAPIVLGEWRHVCIVNQGTTWTYYDKGGLVGISPTSSSNYLADSLLSPNYLGRSNWDGDRLLQGSISDFRVYSVALTASVVADLYAAQGICLFLPKLSYQSPKAAIHNELILMRCRPCLQSMQLWSIFVYHRLYGSKSSSISLKTK